MSTVKMFFFVYCHCNEKVEMSRAIVFKMNESIFVRIRYFFVFRIDSITERLASSVRIALLTLAPTHLIRSFLLSGNNSTSRSLKFICIQCDGAAIKIQRSAFVPCHQHRCHHDKQNMIRNYLYE